VRANFKAACSLNYISRPVTHFPFRQWLSVARFLPLAGALELTSPDIIF
jgi:hypothetical protein